ncbi:hypothetical protein QQP08_014680 [Theobroma cacao]|nr:hypothetical protein QQP08_014680 [Theobroma cacao]
MGKLSFVRKGTKCEEIGSETGGGGTRNCVAEMGICREDRDRTAASRSSSSSSSPSFGLLLISHSTKMFATQKRVQLSSNFCLWKSLS